MEDILDGNFFHGTVTEHNVQMNLKSINVLVSKEYTNDFTNPTAAQDIKSSRILGLEIIEV